MIFWAAEVGSAHKGSESLAYEFIRAFSEAGANILKFQLGWTKEAQKAIGLEYNPVRYIDPWAHKLKDWCFEFNVDMEASIWSETGLETAKQIGLDIFKIAEQMQDKTLIDKIYEFTDAEGGSVLRSGENIWKSPNYPSYPGAFKMPEKIEYGYSDHCHGIEACLLAVARGAVYIEKHVCLDKTDLVTRDTPFSATPAEFAEMVRIGNGIRRLLDHGA